MPSNKHSILTLHYSKGSGRNLAANKNYQGHWGPFAKQFEKPFITNEKRAAFNKMSKEEQDELKRAAGWISGATFEGKWRNKKNLRPRDLMTVDIDYPMPGLIALIETGYSGLSDYVGLWHSSRRHTPKEPRVRGFFPLSRMATTDEYTALVRYAAYKIDQEMKTVDPVSFRPAQMMFMPTVSRDDVGNYFYFLQSDESHEVIDVDAWLEEIEAKFGSWEDLSRLPRHPDEENFRDRAEKAEDPLTKMGPVGDFCRAYPDIEVGMEVFLEGVYTPGDTEGRYTYTGSESSNGAVIYEGKFLYSFHGHDPCNDQLVNLFDLVRIHKFGDQDKKANDDYAKVSDRPSYLAMMEFIKQDKGFREAQKQRKFGAIYEHYADIEPDDEDWGDDGADGSSDPDAPGRVEPDEGEEPLGGVGGSDGEEHPGDASSAWKSAFDGIEPEETEEPGAEEPRRRETGEKASRPFKRKFLKPPKDWLSRLVETTKAGEVIPSLANIKNILQFEGRFWGKIGFNQFSQKVVLIGTIKPGFEGVPDIICNDPVNGDPWQDYMEAILHYIMEAENGDESRGYGMRVAVGDVRMAVEAVARANSFNPVKEQLERWHAEWDGTPACDTMFIRHLGEPDTPYARETARMFMTAACYRIMTPGQKWDNVLVLQGEQGVKKSTYIRTLFTPQWFGELACDLSDRKAVAETIAGIWGLELPELVSMNKTEVNTLKQWTRTRVDDVRMAYGHHVTPLPRQFVAVGTTNEVKPLKDPTGNRVFLMLHVKVREIDCDAVEAELPQLWGHAMHMLAEARKREPFDDLTLDFVTNEARDEARLRQDGSRVRSIVERLTDEILDWVDTPIPLRQWFAEMGLPPKPVEGFNTLDPEDKGPMVLRTTFRERDVRELVFKSDKPTMNEQIDRHIQQVLDKLPGFIKTGTREQRAWRIGMRGIWYDRDGETMSNLKDGYRIVAADSDPHFEDIV